MAKLGFGYLTDIQVFHKGNFQQKNFLNLIASLGMHFITWGILLSLFQKIPKITKSTPVDGFQQVRGQFGVVFHAQSNDEDSVHIS